MAVDFYFILGSIVVACFLGLPLMGIFLRKNQFEVDGRTVLITGGSQGIGSSLGKLLASRGANIVIIARSLKKLEQALAEISSAKIRDTQRFHYISADVTKPEENDRIVREVTAWNNDQTPDIVWANAGTSIPTLFLETSIATLRSQMDINYWAATYLAHSILRAWTQPNSNHGDLTKPKHFIMISSSLAFVNIAGYNPYSPAKAAMRSLSDGLRSEMNLYNGARAQISNPSTPEIKIHCVFPGTIRTPGHHDEEKLKHEVTKELEKADPDQSADEVAIASIKGLERGDYLIATNWLAKLMRAGGIQGSSRNGWGITDTLLSWIVPVAFLFIGPDMENKVFQWGKKNGVATPTTVL